MSHGCLATDVVGDEPALPARMDDSARPAGAPAIAAKPVKARSQRATRPGMPA